MKTFLISLVLCSGLFTSAHGALLFTDVQVGASGLESFTVTTDMPVDYLNFFIGTKSPVVDLFDESLEIIDSLTVLDGGIPDQMPEIITHDDRIIVDYLGVYSGVKMWSVTTFPLPLVDPISGPLVTFNYIPEPATLALLALGAFTLRLRSNR